MIFASKLTRSSADKFKAADKGLVVAQYIRNRRLDFCADAIRHAADDEKLAGIGFHWGFSDQSHFSTVFKQRFGMTPGEYRRKFR